ncbi:hypothetical protein V8E54_010880 [Elaphomyces granulatus]
MDDPLGDTMEMASPYLGTADDFEIDLDIMEDQTFNADDDFDVADASPDASHQGEPLSTVEQPANDAVMLDEVTEPPMIDAFQGSPENHDQLNSAFYQGPGAYESEMLDDEYDEDIDAPFPETKDEPVTEAGHLQSTSVNDKAQGPPREDSPVQREHEQTQPRIGEEDHSPGAYEEKAYEVADQVVAREIEPTLGDPVADQLEDNQPYDQQGDQQGDQHEDTKNAAQVEESHTLDRVDDPPIKQYEGEVDEPSDINHSESRHQEQRESQDYLETEGPTTEETQHIVHLHPVKVLYQDSEISLFPPREGDSSETFFLEDEGLAHEDFGKLLASCRKVLGEHVGDDEALVVDVEPLNLQLCEDSLHISKVTLAQIIELYLHLCRNDGIDAPEPLFVTLSTRFTLLSEISNLIIAANECQGLSHLNKWEEYEPEESKDTRGDGTGVSHDSTAQDEDQEETENPPSATPLQALSRSDEEHVVSNDGTLEKVSGPPGTAKDDSTQVSGSPDKPETNTEVVGISTLSDGRDNSLPATVGQGDRDHDGNFDDTVGASHISYDSEGQTESTATLAHSSLTHNDEQQQGLSAEDSFGHDYVDPSDYDYQLEQDAGEEYIDDDEEEEDSRDLDASEGAAEPDGTTASHTEMNPKLDESHKAALSGGHATTLGASQDLTNFERLDELPDSHGDVKETAQALSDTGSLDSDDIESATDRKHASHDSPRKTPELADDFFGVEDLFASPSKDLKDPSPSIAEEGASDNVSAKRDPQTVTVKNPNPLIGSTDDFEELDFEEDDYLDLEDIGTIDVEDLEPRSDKPQSPENSSRKRSREPEDEFDLSQTPTPDAKRTRST